jgi:hypothetical protein
MFQMAPSVARPLGQNPIGGWPLRAQIADVAGGRGDISNRPVAALEQRLRISKLENSQLSWRWVPSDSAVLYYWRRRGPHACEPASLLWRRTARNDAAACQDEPIVALFFNSQDAPRARDRISGRDLLRTIATVNHRDAVPHTLDAIVSEHGPRVGGSGCFIRGGRFCPRHKRQLSRRGRRKGIGGICTCDCGSLLQLVEPCRETSNF